MGLQMVIVIQSIENVKGGVLIGKKYTLKKVNYRRIKSTDIFPNKVLHRHFYTHVASNPAKQLQQDAQQLLRSLQTWGIVPAWQ
jgi:hypothetical protein